MRKVGIINCFKMSKTCSGRLCFQAVAGDADSFADYGPEGYQLVGFGHCNECCSTKPEDIAQRAASLKAAGADTIHLGTCIKKTCPNYDTFVEILSRDFQVVGYTHEMR